MAGLTQTVIDLLEQWVGAHFDAGQFGGVVFTWEQTLQPVEGGPTIQEYFSSTTYRTAGHHTPANQLFLPVLEAPDIGGSIISSAEFKRSGSVSVGSLALINLNGGLDKYLDGSFVWEGFEGTLKVGAPSWDYADFEELLPTSRIVTMRFTEERIVLSLNHGIANFDEVYQGDLFTYSDIKILDTAGDFIVDSNGQAIGANAVQKSVGEGIIGTPWPDTWGHVRNCEPVLIDKDYGEGWYKYHVSRQGISDVELAYEGGLPLTFPTDWDKVLEFGAFYKITAPQATITAQTKGRVSQPFYFDRPAAISQQILLDQVGLTGGQVDSDSVTDYDAEFDLESGIYIRDPISRREVLDYMTSPRGWWSPTFAGDQIIFGFIEQPSAKLNDVTIENKHIAKVERLRTLPPAWRVVLEYGRNWSRVSDLLGAAPADVRQWIQEDWRNTVAEDLGIPLTYPEAREIRAQTPFYEEPAQEALRQVLLFGQRADLYKFTLGRLPESFWLGDIALISKDRFELDLGKNFYVSEVRTKPTGHEFSLVGWKGDEKIHLPSTGPDSFGIQEAWLDPGVESATDGSGNLTRVADQAAFAQGAIWDSAGEPFNYPPASDLNGKKRFNHEEGEQFMERPGIITGLDAMTFAFYYRNFGSQDGLDRWLYSDSKLDAINGFWITMNIISGLAMNFPEGAGQNKISISSGSGFNDNTSYVVVVTVGAGLGGELHAYRDGTEITDAGPPTRPNALLYDVKYAWTGAGDGADYNFGRNHLYGEELSIENVNNIGQDIADYYGLSQTWNLT